MSEHIEGLLLKELKRLSVASSRFKAAIEQHTGWTPEHPHMKPIVKALLSARQVIVATSEPLNWSAPDPAFTGETNNEHPEDHNLISENSDQPTDCRVAKCKHFAELYAKEAHAKMVLSEYLRANALEEAAQVAEGFDGYDTTWRLKIGAAIRALKDADNAP